MEKIRVIDSHTGGEPTRIIVDGGPPLGDGPLTERLELFRTTYDRYRSAVVNEPRGSDVLVGAILLEAYDPDCAAAVIFFNNVGFLGMCGHGTIGLVTTLAYLGRVNYGPVRIETPVGIVTANLHENGDVSVENVPSYVHARNVRVDVEGYGPISGDIAWGGNWFYLVSDHSQTLKPENTEQLTQFTARIREALEREGVTGSNEGVIDHIELFSRSDLPGIDSRNFVLCPGKAYDRSPCGTGTSAKLACLASEGKIKPGEVWRQESIIGTVFEGSVSPCKGHWIPTIRGSAFVTGDATLIIDPRDPFRWGIGAGTHA